MAGQSGRSNESKEPIYLPSTPTPSLSFGPLICVCSPFKDACFVWINTVASATPLSKAARLATKEHIQRTTFLRGREVEVVT